MRYLQRLIFAFSLAIFLAACSGGDSFTVECQTADDFQRMVVFTYSDARGVKQTTVPLENGRASMTGQSAALTLLSIALPDGRPIADCIVRNGDKVKVTFKPSYEGDRIVSDVRIKGSRPSERLLQFETANDSIIALGFSGELNSLVRDYIDANPGNPESTVLLLRYFDARDREEAADSLMTMLRPEARSAALLQNYGTITTRQLESSVNDRIYSFNLFTIQDSIKAIRPGESRQLLVVFPSSGLKRRAEIDTLRKLWELHDTLRLRIVEIGLEGDSLKWRNEANRDSAQWLQAWTPGNVSSSTLRRFAVPRQPFYILIDSVGNQLYRGSDFAEARAEAWRNLAPRRRKN